MRRVMVLVAGLLLGVGLVVPGAALAGEGCSNEQLRAENRSLGLPDCRAYEMVTPVEKNSARVETVSAPTVAADGSSLAGASVEGFAGIENGEVKSAGGPGRMYYRFSRTGSDWMTTPLNPYRGRLGSIGVGDSVWEPAEDQSVGNRLRLRGLDGSVSEIGPELSPSLGSSRRVLLAQVFGAAAEATNGVVFTIKESGFLWPFDSTISGNPLYEYTGTGNSAPSLVGVSGGAGSTALIGQCGIELGDSTYESGEHNAMSENGETVFFTAVGADTNACGGVQPPVNELLARIGGSQTVAISEPSTADCASCDTSTPADAAFQGASADGSKVFFTTTQQLLGHDASENLYEYDFDSPAGEPKVVRVSAGDGSVSEPVAEVQSVSNVSEDGSHVYFTAKGVLTTAANSAGEHAQVGADNFYVYERDALYPEGRTAFIASCGDIGSAGGWPESQTTPGGGFLVFASSCHLTTGDTSSGRQVFQYDAQTGSMVRVSIGQEGYSENGNATEGQSASIAPQGTESLAGQGALAARGGLLTRSMSDDGSYVFFRSPVALTAQAPHGGVYEYHGGRVSLIAAEGALIGTSASGGDVFFSTAQQLVPQDTDTQVDFYDARVDGGFSVPVAPAGCVGDGCQGSPSAPPAFAAPSSVVFAGGGNLAPPAAEVVVAPKALSAAQKLARALKVCLKEPKRKRASCKAKARRLYGHSSRAVKSDRRGK